MRGASYIAAWQFTFFRIVFGLFLTWPFQKMALPGVGGSAYGLKFEALNAPVINILTRLLDADASTIGFIVFIGFGLLLSIVYTLGFARRVVAVLLLFVWGGVWGNQIIDGIFCSPFYTVKPIQY